MSHVQFRNSQLSESTVRPSIECFPASSGLLVNGSRLRELSFDFPFGTHSGHDKEETPCAPDYGRLVIAS